MERQLDACNSALLRLKRECEEFQVWDNVGDFMIPLMRLSGEFEEFLQHVDAIYVASPHQTHYGYAKAAIQNTCTHLSTPPVR